MRRLSLLALVLTLLVLAGCGGLNAERSFTLNPDTPNRELTIDAASSEQKIQITATADQPISVFVFLKEDRDRIVERVGLAGEKKLPGLLASKEEAEEISLEATVPAKKECMVLAALGKTTKPAQVKVHFKSR
jgi:hypothetical protein